MSYILHTGWLKLAKQVWPAVYNNVCTLTSRITSKLGVVDLLKGVIDPGLYVTIHLYSFVKPTRRDCAWKYDSKPSGIANDRR